jgi:hypothetical protein
MATWSENQIATVGSQASRFPDHQVIHWMELRAAPEKIRALVQETNVKMTGVESSRELAPEGVKNQRAQLAKTAIAELDKVIEPAQRAAARRIEALNQKLSTAIAKPEDASVAAEIRRHIAGKPSPILAALALKGHAETVAAILGAPSYLSGLSEQEAATLRTQVLSSTDQHKELREIQNALNVCHQTVKSATAMILERAKMRQSHDGTWQEIP